MANINSISVLHELLGYEKPKHPLITLIDLDQINPREEYYNIPFTLNYYMISLKNNPDCELVYGRKYFDFREGSLIFTAPGQMIAKGRRHQEAKTNGWMLCFHTDLIRGSSLWHKMSEYSFFEYDANEALQLSDLEKETIERIVRNIQVEYSGNLDIYSNDLIVSNLEVLLNYAKRFYGRQFITRAIVMKESVVKFEILLNERCSVESIEQSGMPTVKGLAQAMGYSPNYLSDMLKKETGKTVQEYIKLQVLELAKKLLLMTGEPIYRIADKLGFEQPSSFTKFFKVQLGISPADFRKLHAGG
ncbi:helix-turn-helix domain-containing protein [Anaerocolumna jejuensis]|uniref:helix-turn-helix domain-containing protein n=1 Tax=Anaerocolumna jejuensis TaxID=259063 RepID=UPI003F7CC0A8